MLKKLRLERFKNFKKAELTLGPFTLLVGANASGKSNLRDAFRFLHGVARGYTLAEILGEKYGEGGERQWRGIRGGTREVASQGASTFALEAEFTVEEGGETRDAAYRIEVDPGKGGKPPRVVAERLKIQGHGPHVFDSHPDDTPPVQSDKRFLRVQTQRRKREHEGPYEYSSHTPVLSQIADRINLGDESHELARLCLGEFRRMRFLELSPEAMRIPSLPGQTILGDRGENLSSVLQAICEDPKRKAGLADWIQGLTPMDARDFEFPADPAGRILVTLVEKKGQRTSAYSASDGTLRFLALFAALRGPEPAQFYFFEELENGIHPTRLHLLTQVIEQTVSEGALQVVATTHSPLLLHFASSEAQEYAALTYRLEHTPDARIRRILDIPDARRLVEKEGMMPLHESGWFENVLAFDEARSDEAAE